MIMSALSKEEFNYWKARLIKDQIWDCDYFDKLTEQEQYIYVESERFTHYPNPDKTSKEYTSAYKRSNDRNRDIFKRRPSGRVSLDSLNENTTDDYDSIIDLLKKQKFGSQEDFIIFCIDNGINHEDYLEFFY